MPGLVIAAVAPHGGIVVPELCDPEELDAAETTRSGLEELGRRFAAAAPDAVVVVTPHNVHVRNSLAVIVAGEVAGSLEEDGRAISLSCPVDLELATSVLDGLDEAGIPAVSVSYGSNRPNEATMPLDWGAFIPLWFMGGRWNPPVPVVLLAPAREVAAELHVRAGAMIAKVAAASGKRVGLIASADHGHAHDADGPYGFDPASAAYDARVAALVRGNSLDRLIDFDPAFVADAQADSWWQLLVLHGATAGGFDAELLSYEAPTYFGMLCACFTPKPSG